MTKGSKWIQKKLHSLRATDGYTGGFEFTPGQYLTIRIPELGAAPRHYTITSKVQRSAKRYANLAKQDPGRVRQNR